VLTAEIGAATPRVDPSEADVVAIFSSRGPALGSGGVLKPDVSAPGVVILAADADAGGGQMAFLSGTSMASPHVAGAAALLKALHPVWKPQEIRSALILTAKPVPSSGDAPGNPFDFGSGRIHVGDAARTPLIMDETRDAFLAANPALQGDPTGLNLPSLTSAACKPSCSWSRTFRSTSERFEQFNVSFSPGSPGLVVTPDVLSFGLASGDQQTIGFVADTSGTCSRSACPGGWRFARVEVKRVSSPEDDGADSTLGLAVAVNPEPSVLSQIDALTDPEVVLDFDRLSSGATTIEEVIAAFPESGLQDLRFTEEGYGETTTYDFGTGGGRALKPGPAGTLELIDPRRERLGVARSLTIDLAGSSTQFGIEIGDLDDRVINKVSLFSRGELVAAATCVEHGGRTRFFESTESFNRIVIEDGLDWVVPSLVLAVPEPSGVALFTCALASLAFLRWRAARALTRLRCARDLPS
jgi:hypothetical protein